MEDRRDENDRARSRARSDQSTAGDVGRCEDADDTMMMMNDDDDDDDDWGREAQLPARRRRCRCKMQIQKHKGSAELDLILEVEDDKR